MTRLIILPPAASYLKKLEEKPLKDRFQAAIDQLLLANKKRLIMS